jgi:hypothetical protein
MTFNVFTQEKRLEKLNDTHWNPVKRGLVENRKNGSGPGAHYYETGEQRE